MSTQKLLKTFFNRKTGYNHLSSTTMPATINYKTLTFIQKSTRNTKTYSKAISVYNPNSFNKHIINIIKPSITLKDIEDTIFEEKIIRTAKTPNPLYSFVWFLN